MATTGQSHGRQRKACGTKWNRTKVKIIGKNCEFRFFFFFLSKKKSGKEFDRV